MKRYKDINAHNPLETPVLEGEDCMEECIYNLIETELYERPFRLTLNQTGDSISQLFDLITPTNAATLLGLLSDLISQGENRIVINKAKSTCVGDPDTNTYHVTLVYSIQGLNVESEIEFPVRM